jgi:hypothetical protein
MILGQVRNSGRPNKALRVDIIGCHLSLAPGDRVEQSSHDLLLVGADYNHVQVTPVH